jgi:hypothetical protein
MKHSAERHQESEYRVGIQLPALPAPKLLKWLYLLPILPHSNGFRDQAEYRAGRRQRLKIRNVIVYIL